MNILLAVEEAAGIQTLKAVHQSEHKVVAVLTQSSIDSDSQRGATVAGVANNLGYDVWPARRVKDPELATLIKEHEVDLLLNVHSLYIIHEAVVEAPRTGSFNLHPGPLPHYAGMNAPSWAIFNGEQSHGVTLHWMTAGIDEGHIAYQTNFDLKASDTGLSVSTQCVRSGIQLIKNLLSAEAIPRHEQDFSKRKYFGFEVPFDGKINWAESSVTLERFIRASDFYPLPSPWKTPLARLNGEPIGILKAALTDETAAAEAGTLKHEDSRVLVATGEGWLELKKLMVAGKVISPAEHLASSKKLESG